MADDKLRLVVCEVFRREAESLIESERFADVSLRTFPPECLRTSGRIDGSPGAAESGRRDFRQVCHSAIRCAPAVKDREGQDPSPDPAGARQCLETVADGAFLHYLQIQGGAFTVSPGWLDLWQDYMRQWGFDRETAQAFFKESASEVMLLDTGIDPQAEQHAADFAGFVGLPFKRIAIGLDHMRLGLTARILPWRAARSLAKDADEKKELNRRLGNFVLMAEVFHGVASINDEARVLEKGLEFVSATAAPGRLDYVPVVKGALAVPLSSGRGSKAESAAWKTFLSSSDDYRMHPSGHGFLIRVRHGQETIGILDLDRIAFPQYLDDYLNLLLSYADVLGLAVMNARNFEELLRNQKLLQIQASTDALTGVMNRSAVMERLAVELARAKREGRPVCAAMLDIDHFKQVNDLYGHAAGDAVLMAVTGAVSRSLRPYDAVGRLGGEEFLIIAPGADQANACGLCERIRRGVEALGTDFAGTGIRVTVSIGFATAKGDIEVERLIHLADEAMYRAKKAGRNRVEFAGDISGP